MQTRCWQWTAAGKHYGVFWYKGKNVSSHRISYFIDHKIWPDMVLHKCDNKKCVNPAHLYSGDVRQNALDASLRGRLVVGAANNKTKLSVEKVIFIKHQLKQGVSMLRLANAHGVSHQAIRNIVCGKAWAYVCISGDAK